MELLGRILTQAALVEEEARRSKVAPVAALAARLRLHHRLVLEEQEVHLWALLVEAVQQVRRLQQLQVLGATALRALGGKVAAAAAREDQLLVWAAMVVLEANLPAVEEVVELPQQATTQVPVVLAAQA